MRKQHSLYSVLGVIVLAATTHTAHGQWSNGQWNGPANYHYGLWYFRTGIGPDFVQNSSLGLSQPNATVKFDPGVRFDFAGGYQFTPFFSLEGQVGALFNNIHSIEGSPSADANFTQVPVLANAVFQLPNDTHWIPFAGVGCGFSASQLDIHHATFFDPDLGVPVALHGNSATTVFAYQAFAGVRYDFDPFGISLSYEFLGTTQPDWDVHGDNAFPSTQLVMNHVFTHSVIASFTLRF